MNEHSLEIHRMGTTKLSIVLSYVFPAYPVSSDDTMLCSMQQWIQTCHVIISSFRFPFYDGIYTADYQLLQWTHFILGCSLHYLNNVGAILVFWIVPIAPWNFAKRPKERNLVRVIYLNRCSRSNINFCDADGATDGGEVSLEIRSMWLTEGGRMIQAKRCL